MRLQKMGVVVPLLVVLMGQPVLTEAKWHCPIHSGDHVFDAKRFADSVRETAEAVKEVANTLEVLGNQLKMLAKAGDIQGMWRALEHVGDLPAGKEASEYTDIFRRSWEAAKDNAPYWQILHASLAESLEDTGRAAEDVFLHQEERQEAQRELLAAQDEGLLSEQQRQNMEHAIGAMNTIDQSELMGSRFLQDIEAQEAEFTSRRIEQEKAKAGEFYGYDPYHPNEYDREHRIAKTHSLGFMNYGQSSR